jgi:cytochrome oxidase Cu insertion factor (SCO1/SenC/PrrC family)
MNHKIFRIALLAALAVFLLVALAWQWGFISSAGREGQSSGIARIGGPFALTDQNSQPRSKKDFAGRLMLIYFGYSYCPDACPTALQVMSSALQALGPKASDVQPIFITIDPARDNPAHLKDYVENFFPGMVGLTGSEDAVKKAADAYRVYYRKATDGDSTEYLMDHSSIVFLMGRDGNYLTHFTHQTPPAKMADVIRKHL